MATDGGHIAARGQKWQKEPFPYGRPTGYGEVNDAERLCQAPAFWLHGSRQAWKRGRVLTSCSPSFDAALLTPPEDRRDAVAAFAFLGANQAIHRVATMCRC
jgi:hypothetical protein